MRFIDAFTGALITLPLEVRVEALPAVVGMPRLPWRAYHAGDGTYRFQTTGWTIPPVGATVILVTAPGGEYLDLEPAPVVLPRPIAGPFPTRGDMIVTHRLWPTRRLTLPIGETAVVGTLRTVAGAAAAGYRVTLGEAPIGAATPYGYTDATGDFLVRMPNVRTMSLPPASAIRTDAPLSIEIRSPPAFAALIAPAAPAFPLPVTIGRSSTLFITIP
jgi:hypothetical protein